MNKNIEICLRNLDYIKKNNPLGVLFKTDNNSYLFDTGTCKVVRCKNFEFYILDCILSNRTLSQDILMERFRLEEEDLAKKLINFCNIIKSEDLLNVTLKRSFVSPNHNNLKDNIESDLRQLVLEVTEKCNLRCKYCTYSKDFNNTRNHGYKNMSVDIALSAIDYLKEHGNKKEVVISFYGGEPLIMVDLIKKCVAYASKTITDRKLIFTTTTNLTLMTPKLANYISSIENFIVIGSLDGPKDIHDKYRVDINNSGTFDKAINGLKYLINALGDDCKSRLLINSVYTPIYSKQKLDYIANFFNEDWLPEGIANMITYPEDGSVPSEFYKGMDTRYDVEDSLFSWCKQDFVDNVMPNNKNKLSFKDVIDGGLKAVHKRRVSSSADFNLPLNGCCVPGGQRIFISPNGDIRICEKIMGPTIVGNVTNSINIYKIKSLYIDDYCKLSIDDCSNCWLSKTCSLCYAHFYKNGVFDTEGRKNQCKVSKLSFKSALEFYWNCYEKNPEIFDFMYNEKSLSS
ncbi:radical SAM protein [Clostridiaceae bacterium M8S5]|nr:radical SAM protein [Clostridiaceae bacterium M8S5]